ncbi:hypothetical protein SRHO_G00197200 [Serrasalmus rhombeus]
MKSLYTRRPVLFNRNLSNQNRCCSPGCACTLRPTVHAAGPWVSLEVTVKRSEELSLCCHGKAVRVDREVGIGLGHRRGCG